MNIDYIFNSGNYPGAASSNGHTWQKYAALGMLGKTKKSLDGLTNLAQTNESLLYIAISYWIAGNDDVAIELLKHNPIDYARNLLTLISKPHINVISQLPWISKGTQDLQSGAEYDPKFIVKNIGFKPQDLQNRPYANVHDFYDPQNPPDLYISQMVEWHLIPPNIQELPCPIFGQTSDYDLHIQFLHPWLRLFDELIVNGPDEQDEVGRLSGVPVSAYPKTFSIPDTLPPLPPPGQREVDFFMSGTTFHPYHHDKALLVNRILDIPDFNSLFYNGFLSSKAYYELLSHSKMALTFVRHADAMPTRGLESLAMGCALLVQKKSVLNQYLGEEEGVVTYEGEHDLPAAMKRVKRDWPLFEQRARRGAEIVRREFSSARVASQYLRFLTVLAAKPRPKRQMLPIAHLDQKRPIIIKGWGFPHHAYKEMQDINASRWLKHLEEKPCAATVIDLAREYLLDFCTWAHLPTARNYPVNQDYYHYGMLSKCLELFRIGAERFPRSLVLRFTMIRAALHFGSPAEVDEAIQLLRATLAIPPAEWVVAPMDDVMPWDFFSQMFNYRGYFDAVTSILKGDDIPATTLVDFIRASLFYYQGHYSGDTSDLQAAVRLDSSFPFYRLRLAAALIKCGTRKSSTDAAEHLELLAGETMLCLEAFRLLELLEESFDCRSEHLVQIKARFRNIRDSLHNQKFQSENWNDPHLQMSAYGGVRPLTTMQLAMRSEPPASVMRSSSTLRILYISLDFSNWAGAKEWTYPSNLSIEEGFAASGVEFLTIPLIYGISAEIPASWLYHAKTLCAGREFDQVWIELVHGNPGEDILEWLISLAPVRLGILLESLSYDQEDYQLHPGLFKRRLVVEERLRYMTHAVTVDEKDADDLNRRGIVKAMWRPESVPSWCLANAPNDLPRDRAIFYGASYGTQKRWLLHSDLAGLFEMRPSAEAGTIIPHAFTSVGSAALKTLNSGRIPDQEFLEAYLDCLRSLRRVSFANWIRLASETPLIVNLPSITKAQSGRVVEAMAAGCPVLTWELPDRPKANALFRNGEELLQFPRDNPAVLADRIRYLKQHPDKTRAMAGRALEKVRNQHTTEQRVKQILRWIDTGNEPNYNEDVTIPIKTVPVDVSQASLEITLQRFFAKTGRGNYVALKAPVRDIVSGKRTTEEIIGRVGVYIERKDLASVQLLLEEAVIYSPSLTTVLAQLYYATGDFAKAEEMLLQALSVTPNDAEIHIRLAQLASMAGNQEIASIYIEQALALGPPEKEILSLLKEYRRSRKVVTTVCS